jgi:hypothetical protein
MCRQIPGRHLRLPFFSKDVDAAGVTKEALRAAFQRLQTTVCVISPLTRLGKSITNFEVAPIDEQTIIRINRIRSILEESWISMPNR